MMKRALISVVMLGGLCSVSALGSTFVAGMENSLPGTSVVEGIGDYNDLMVSLSAAGLNLVSTDGGVWGAFSSAIVNESQTYPTTNANPFWDNQSLDGSDKNIGFCLTTNNCGLGGSAGSPVDSVTQFLSGAGGQGSADNAFYFSFGGGQVTTVDLNAIASTLTPQESLGWYNIADPSCTVGSDCGVIVPLGAAGTPGNYDFTPGAANFGLWFYANGTYYFTQNNLDGASASRFAVFQNASVPEPGTMALFGLGALLLGLVPRLRKRG